MLLTRKFRLSPVGPAQPDFRRSIKRKKMKSSIGLILAGLMLLSLEIVSGCVSDHAIMTSTTPVEKEGKRWEGPFHVSIPACAFGYDGTVVYKDGKPWSGQVPGGSGSIDDWYLDSYSNGVVVSRMTLREYYLKTGTGPSWARGAPEPQQGGQQAP
jgi:hypothetical protein